MIWKFKLQGKMMIVIFVPGGEHLGDAFWLRFSIVV